VYERKKNVQACILKEIRVNPMAYSDENGCVRLFWNVSGNDACKHVGITFKQLTYYGYKYSRTKPVLIILEGYLTCDYQTAFSVVVYLIILSCKLNTV
jgi:hypothetical protein